MCRESASPGHLSSGNTYISIRCGAYTTDCPHVHKGITHAAQWIYTDSLSSNSGFPNWQGQTFPGIGNHVPKHRDICSRPFGTRVPCSRMSPTCSFQDYLPALSWYIRGVKPVSRLKNLEKADALGKFNR